MTEQEMQDRWTAAVRLLGRNPRCGRGIITGLPCPEHHPDGEDCDNPECSRCWGLL